MNWIWIQGPKTLFPSLVGISGLEIEHADFVDLGDQQRISAEATDAAILEIQALGLTVEVEKTDAQVAQYIAAVLADEDPDDIGVG